MDDEIKNLEAELKMLQPIRPSPAMQRRLETELAEPIRQRRWRTVVAAIVLPAAAVIAALCVLPARKVALDNTRSTTPSQRDVNASDAGRGLRTPSIGSANLQIGPRSATSATTMTAAANILKPVSAENLLYAVTDEGTVTLDDGTPARRERLEFVDTIHWKNPNTHASVTWSIPREEVRVVPIRYQ